MRQQVFFEDRLRDVANDRREVDGSELPSVCCAGGFCDWGYYCAVPIFRDLGTGAMWEIRAFRTLLTLCTSTTLHYKNMLFFIHKSALLIQMNNILK